MSSFRVIPCAIEPLGRVNRYSFWYEFYDYRNDETVIVFDDGVRFVNAGVFVPHDGYGFKLDSSYEVVGHDENWNYHSLWFNEPGPNWSHQLFIYPGHNMIEWVFVP